MDETINTSDLVWHLTKEDIINDMKESYGVQLTEEDFDLVREYFSWGLEQPRDIVYKTIFEDINKSHIT